MTPGSTYRRNILQAILLLLIILALAIAVRVYRLGAQCFWVDELLTMEDLNGRGHADVYLPRNVLMAPAPRLTDPKYAAPWWKIWKGLEEESHPPLYFICCRWWRDVFGNSEVSIRSLSVIFSLASIGLLFAVVRNLSGFWPAFWSALLLALAAPQVAYAQEARNYSMLIAMSLLAATFLIQIEKRGLNLWRWMGFTLALLATALTHYFSFGVLAAMAIYSLLIFRRQALLKVLGAFAAAAMIFVVAWGKNLLLQQKMLMHDFPMYADPVGHSQATLLRVISLPLRQLIGIALPNSTAIVAGIVVIIAAIVSIVYRRRDLLLWWLWLIGAIGTVAILDMTRTAEQLTMVKYTLAAGPAACAIAAAWLPKKFFALRHLFALALVGLEICCLPAVYRDWKGDWLGASVYAAEITPPVTPLLIAGNGSGRPTLSWLYLGMDMYVNFGSRPIAICDREPSPALVEQLQKYSHVTLVTDCPTASPTQLVPGFVPYSGGALYPNPNIYPNVGIVWSLIKK